MWVCCCKYRSCQTLAVYMCSSCVHAVGVQCVIHVAYAVMNCACEKWVELMQRCSSTPSFGTPSIIRSVLCTECCNCKVVRKSSSLGEGGSRTKCQAAVQAGEETRCQWVRTQPWATKKGLVFLDLQRLVWYLISVHFCSSFFSFSKSHLLPSVVAAIAPA